MEHVSFDQVGVGDILSFATADNGYGGSGYVYWRTGAVTKVTAKTVRVECGSNSFGPVAVLRRADWTARAVTR